MQGAADFAQLAWDSDAAPLSKEQIAPTGTSALMLAEAFADFVATSSRLENSYRELQSEVASLHEELGKRNEDLRLSFAENQRVRFALQQVVDSMPCGVLVANVAGEISTINPEMAKMLGIPALQTIRTLEILKAQTGFELRSQNPATERDIERECRLQTAEGERWLQVRERSLSSADRSSAQTIYIVSDITANKRAERDREAARNATVLAEITTMLAHEIRNPLASLELFAELIEQDDAQRQEWISNLRAGIRSLSGTVNNVLSMHDPGSLRLSAISAKQTITNAVRFVQPVANQAGVSLKWATNDLDADILANESALQQVLLNLIRNSIRHTPSGGAVILQLQHDANGCVTISCSDSGSGIRPDQLHRLFEAGFSGSGDTPGLGLAVCSRIMQQHGGAITASNVKGSGARFLLSFPSLQQEHATA